MGKSRDLFQKFGDIKGKLLERMGAIKNRNSKDLTQADKIKKRWQEYTEEPCKKGLNDLDNHDDVVTHLELNILECEVKQSLGSITMNKPNGGDGLPIELFQILKDDAVKVLHSIGQQIWKTRQEPWTGKGQFSFQSQRREMPMFKLPHNCTHFTCQQGKAQNPSSQASAVHEQRTSRCTSCVLKRQRNHRPNCQHLLGHGEGKGVPDKHLLLHH